jgi:polyhydroxyalkanoate synthase
MKYYILDLSPHNSLIKYLVDQGHSVFCISWKNPGAEDRDLGMDDYLELGFHAALNAVNAIIPGRKVHAAGYCLGGTLLSIANAGMARDGDHRLASVTLFAAQTDFTEPGELALFIDDSQISILEAQMAQKGYLTAGQMAGAFQLLRSNDLLWSRSMNEYLLGEREPMSDLMAWNADATRMPARMHGQYLRHLFLNDDLSEGRYLVHGKPVSLGDIRTPLFCVGTETDHIAPWRSVYKLHYMTQAEITFVLASGGHNAGIVSEPGHPRRRYRICTSLSGDSYMAPDDWMNATPIKEGSWWPEWIIWLKSRSGPRGATQVGRRRPPVPGIGGCSRNLCLAKIGYQPESCSRFYCWSQGIKMDKATTSMMKGLRVFDGQSILIDATLPRKSEGGFGCPSTTRMFRLTPVKRGGAGRGGHFPDYFRLLVMLCAFGGFLRLPRLLPG